MFRSDSGQQRFDAVEIARAGGTLHRGEYAGQAHGADVAAARLEVVRMLDRRGVLLHRTSRTSVEPIIDMSRVNGVRR